MTDLGTLGGQNSFALGINDRGQVVGLAQLNDIPDPIFGFAVYHAVIWYKGAMTDLGAGPRSDAIGSDGFNINNRGQVVGRFALPNATERAVAQAYFWESGIMHDLGVPAGLGDDNSEALSLNNNGQIVGDSGIGFEQTYSPDHALLWQEGEWTDLNTLIPTDSGYHLIVAFDINARGQIVVCAVQQSTGDIHAALLTPQDSKNEAMPSKTSVTAARDGLPTLSEDARRLLELARRAKFPHTERDR
jgi:probable HAF family extracellular repeat protein